MHDDVYQMYLDEIAAICPMDAAEEEQLIQKLKSGDTTVRSRLMEGYLPFIAETAKSYADQGLPIGDLVQEANMALIMAVDQYQDGDFKSQVKALAEEMIKAALEEQGLETKVEEEMLARVNVLKEVSKRMAEELGREASVTELAEKMNSNTKTLLGWLGKGKRSNEELVANFEPYYGEDGKRYIRRKDN